MGDSFKQRSRVKFGGGSFNGFTETTILLGKGQKITEIDYHNISINPLIFQYPLLQTYDFTNNLGSNFISIADGVYITSNEVINSYQKNLIPNNGILIDSNNKISVDFKLSGWINNYNNINYTYSNIGIGTKNPLANIHINNNNASIIIDNNYNKFKFNYNDLNYFVFGNYTLIDDIRQHIEQFKIHANANSNSIVINENNSIDINSNININGNSFLSPNIFINNSNITHWLSNNGLASLNYVNQKIITTPNTILKGKGKDITELDYNNIIYNKLNFLSPFNIDDSNNVSIDLNVSGGWTKDNTNIYSTNSKIGIGTTMPMANLHIGRTKYSITNLNDNDGSMILSRSSANSNRNFKFGYDTNFNFILGDVSLTNIWNSRIIFNNNNTININNNLLINGSITLNTFNINYDNSTSNFTLGTNLLFINNRSGNIGIGINPSLSYKLIIDGNTRINSNLDILNINANNCFCSNITVNSIIESKNNIITTNLTSTNLITSQNIYNYLNITTNTFNSSTIINKNLITTNDISCTNNITANTINLNSATVLTSLTSPLINSTTLNTTTINSTNINNTNNINATNLNTINLTSRIINCDNTLTANTVRTTILNSTDIITTNLLNTITANLTNLTATNTITSLNMRCTNTFTGTTINTTSLSANTLNSPTITATNLSTTNLATTGNITCSGVINTNNLIANSIISFNNIGIGTNVAREALHLSANNTTRINSSLIFTNLNNTSIKIGYDINNFIIGTFNIDNNNWNNQFSINSTAPINSININSTGNIGIGVVNTNDNNYKMLINGTLNATNFFKNGEELSTLNYVNQQFISRLTPYLTITDANNNYYKNNVVDSLITTNVNNIINTIANSFQFEDNVYLSITRLPKANSLINTTIFKISSNYFNDTITGIKETFFEEKFIDNFTTINYEIYYSSGNVKLPLFTYISSTPILDIEWNQNTYTNIGIFDFNNNNYSLLPNNFYNLPSLLNDTDFNITVVNNRLNSKAEYRGEYIIFKVSETFTLKKFRFYVRNMNGVGNISYAPGSWLCYGSNDGINWTYIKIASNVLHRLTLSSYIYVSNYSYYEQNLESNTFEFTFIGFIFNGLVDFSGISRLKTLTLSRIEFFGKFKIKPIYITSNYFDTRIQNYALVSSVNSKLSKNINFIYPIVFENNSLFISPDYIFSSGNNTNNISELISNYISTYTNVWKSDENNPDNYYYSNLNGCVGIGLSNVNILNINNLKLDINGTAKATKIIADTFSGNGAEITNINYNTLVNKPDLRNLYNWNNYEVSTDITNCYASFTGNIGIGNLYTSTLLYKLNVDGSIYSTQNIIGNNIIENGTSLIDKYLTINYAALNYFSNIGGIISGSIGIGTSADNTYKLNINGDLNSTGIFENGINLINKYLTISSANSIYLSKISGGTINNNLLITGNVGIGTTNLTNNKLSIDGSIYSTSNIISSNFTENGINLINKYLTINNASQTYFNIIGGIISNSVGIGTSPSSSHLLNVNGSIYSSNNIICTGNFIENGYNLSNKYLSIYTASNNYLSSVNPIITGNISCSGTITENNILLTDKYLSLDVQTINCNIGFGTSSSSLYKINVNGSIFSSNNIICTGNFIENGSNLTDKYLSIYSASNNYLSNINPIITGNISCSGTITENNILLSNKYLSRDVGIINCNVGFGTAPTSLYKINVNGSIFSSNNIICTGNFIENNSSLSDKYLSIFNASINYLSNINPIITGNISCSGTITENNILLSNKYLSRDVGIINCNVGFGTAPTSLYKINVNGSIFSSNNIICTGNFIENNSNLSDKYLSIFNASINYLSNINPIITGNISCSGTITENGILLSNKYLSQNAGVINTNIGFGINPSSLYKINIDGSMFATNNIICNSNFIEQGTKLENKYLSIHNASNNYLSNINPIIYGNISCSGSITENGILLANKYLSRNFQTLDNNIGFGTTPSPLYRLNVNGSIFSSNDIICSNIISDNIKEKGSNLSDTYVKISDILNYTIDNHNIQKKIGIKFICSNVIILNNITYYKYNINISQYVNSKLNYVDNNPYRIFNIKCFSTDTIFRQNLENLPPNILQYDIYMSNLLNLNPVFLNICAIGFPTNYYLTKITKGDIFVLKTNNFNYISILSKYQNANISCIITDFLF
jgi:hypothetical protein